MTNVSPVDSAVVVTKRLKDCYQMSGGGVGARLATIFVAGIDVVLLHYFSFILDILKRAHKCLEWIPCGSSYLVHTARRLSSGSCFRRVSCFGVAALQ
jgi:hypothetical protein